ncbi:MAG: hypothetical protein ACRDNK_08495, partial [Solirubrobacteraceae bacterium]
MSGDRESDDVWLGLVQASIAFLDTDAAFGSTAGRTRSAKVRLEDAVNDFAAYQEGLRRLPAPVLR